MPIVKDRKLAWSHCLCLFTVALLFLGMPLLSGCSDDDDDEGIWVCNFDDEDYTVRLWRSNSNPDTAVSYIVDEFELDDIFEIGGRTCNDFEDPGIYSGWHFITIHENGAAVADDTSEDFYFEVGEYEGFSIDSTGDINRD